MMKFLLVNDRQPREDAYCTLCTEKVTESYVREIGTRLMYCDHQCYGGHVKVAVLALEYHARHVS
jgi:hypothetical protein